MANRRKPNAAKEAAGTLRSNRHKPEAEISGTIEMPEWLTDPKAWESWNFLVPKLDEAGYLASTDADTLARYCRATADYRTAIEEMDRDGRTIVTATGAIKNHPAWVRQKDAAAEMHRLSSELGLSPSSRASLGDKGFSGREVDAFSAWEEGAA